MAYSAAAVAPGGPARHPSPVDRLLDTYLDGAAALDPTFATLQGILGHDAELPDLSPAGLAARSQLRVRTLIDLDRCAVEPGLDSIDRVSVAAAREELGVAEELHERGEAARALDNVDSPVQRIRQVFDLMPADTDDDWRTIAQRLRAVEPAIAGYRESLRYSADRGRVAARRQVRAAAAQAARNVGPDGFFATFAAAGSESAAGTELTAAAQRASAAYAGLVEFLSEELLPLAPAADPVGRERYALFSRQFLGTSVDLAQTYQWGQDELARIRAEMDRTAGRILPGASVAEAVAHLDADPQRRLPGAAALQAWMQEVSDTAVAELGATQFDIPEPVRTLECRIAPTTSGVIYYTGPSEDFSRPGRMWWSIPSGLTQFTTWQERTTVYHEGVPGHHLQIGQTAYRRDLLNRWRRLGCWVSGHGEGWALYAEHLMAELGYLEDPGDYLGMLTGQALRAARVVIDVGVHCGFPAPASLGGGPWTWEKAAALLSAHCLQPPEVLEFELTRYLGWPGQASSYKLGERAWLELREQARRAEGASFELKAFHCRALAIGSVGLDVLRGAVLAGNPGADGS